MTAPALPRNWTKVVIASVVVAIIVIGGGFWWWRAHRTGTSFSAVFTSAVGVYPGSGVRILGVPAGAVDSVTPRGQTVTIKLHLNPGVHVAATTGAVIISPNLVGDRYIQLTGPDTGGPRLTSGSTLGTDRTATPVEVDQLYSSLISLTTALGPNGANANGALSKLLDVGAQNLGGNNGKDLNKTIKGLSQAAGTLAGSSDKIFATVDNLSSFTAMLQSNNDGLVKVNEEFKSVTQTLADDRQSFGAAMDQLAGALSLVQQFIQANHATLQSNIGKLTTLAQTLSAEKDSIAKALTAAPLLTQNFINAYDPKLNVLDGRANLNELTIWANGTTASTSSDSAAPVTSSGQSLPPTLLPSTNVSTGGGR